MKQIKSLGENRDPAFGNDCCVMGIMIPGMFVFDTETKIGHIVFFGEDRKPRAYVQVPIVQNGECYDQKTPIHVTRKLATKDESFVISICGLSGKEYAFFYENKKPFTEEDYPVMKENLENELKEKGEM